MGDWGYNPPHGWSQGPWEGIQGCLFQDPYGWAPATHGFFPAPPGLAWYELPDPNGGCAGGMSMGGMSMGGCSGSSFGGCSLGGSFGGPTDICSGVPSSAASGQTWQQLGTPVSNGGVPGINLRNRSGGIGLEPGYNYLFPPSHCKMHVLKCAAPPWQSAGGEALAYNAHVVPTCVTLKELLQQFGCDNADPAKNVLHEVAQGGGGRWYRGIAIKGDNADLMGKRVADMGWGEKKDGKEGEVVWLYFTKD